MIKLHSSKITPDYTEYGRVTTDCKTVGEFMTEAAAIFDSCVIIVDGCRYEFIETPKVRVTDYTPIGIVAMADNGDIVITTKPMPETVKKSGWVNIYDQETHYRAGRIFDTQEQAKEFELSGSVATARVEWEEVKKLAAPPFTIKP